MSFTEPNFNFDPDPSINPGDDYYEYVNKKWLENNSMPNDYTRYGSFELLHKSNLEKIKGIVSNEDHAGELPVKLYKCGMDEDRLEKQKFLAIELPLKDLKKAATKKEIFNLGVTFRGKRYLKTIFDIYTSGDKKDSSNNIIYMQQGGLGLPDRDYYLEESKKDDLVGYQKYLSDILKLLNENFEKAGDIVDFEKKIAEIHLSKIEQRDSLRTYNIRTRQEIKEIAPEFDWDNYFNGITEGKISISSPEYIEKLSKLWAETDIETLRSYFIARTISSAAAYMTDEIYLIQFNFYNKQISGQKEPKPRWKRVLSTVQDDLGEPLGKIYSELYFTTAAKKKALDMIEFIRQTMNEKIKNVEWMEDITKDKALKKLNSFNVKIGYPDKWKDFSSLEQEMSDEKAPTYYEKVVAASKFTFDHELGEAYNPVDKDKWFMNANDVNAYYHPIMNEIVFPAGILQKPFFHYDYTDAENFGGIGAVIAHEMTHGFDDQGRLYNDEGMMGNWWSDNDIKNYEERTKIIDEQFSAFELYGEKVKGKLTMGENIADIGGIKLAFAGLKKKMSQDNNNFNENDIFQAPNRASSDYKQKYSPAEILFMSWARVWCAHITKEDSIKRLSTDPHSPNVFRVNGILGNVEEFFTAYGLGKEAGLWPKEMAEIW